MPPPSDWLPPPPRQHNGITGPIAIGIIVIMDGIITGLIIGITAIGAKATIGTGGIFTTAIGIRIVGGSAPITTAITAIMGPGSASVSSFEPIMITGRRLLTNGWKA